MLTVPLPVVEAASSPYIEYYDHKSSAPYAPGDVFEIEVKCSEYGSTVNLYANGALADTDTDGRWSDPEVTYQFPYAGTYTMKIRCQGDSGYSSPNNHQWTYTVGSTGPTNSAPSASRTSPSTSITLDKGDSQKFELYCTDPDSGDDLESHWRQKHGSSTVDSRDNDGDIWGNSGNDAETFTFNSDGSSTVEAWCTDDAGATSNKITWYIDVRVQPTNSAPSASRTSPSSSVSLDVGESQRFEIYCTDPDSGDDLESHWRQKHGSNTIDSHDNDGDIWGNSGNDAETFTFSSSGSYTVEAWCTDESGYASNTVTWSISATDTNQAPSASRTSPSSSSINLQRGDRQTFEIFCTDPDSGDELAGNWRHKQGSTTLETRSNAGDIWGNSGNDAESFTFSSTGSYTVEAWCTDEGGYASNTITWSISATDTNHAPGASRTSPSSSLSLTAGDSQKFEISCTDPDGGDDLESHWRQKHGSSTVDSRDNDADMMGTSGNDAESFTFSSDGSYTIEAWCTDKAQAQSNTITWSVQVDPEDAPSPPSVQAYDVKSRGPYEVGDTFEVEVKCSEYGSTVVLTANGATVDTATDPWGSDPQLTYTFPSAGAYTLRVRCQDDAGQSGGAEPSWSLTVNPPADPNDAPTASRTSPSSSITVAVGDDQRFEFSCTDPDRRDDLESHWRQKRGSSTIDSRDNDADMMGASGNDAETFTFPTVASYKVEAWCTDKDSAKSNTVTWNIEVPPPDDPDTGQSPDDGSNDDQTTPSPSIVKTDVKSSAPYYVGDTFEVEVKCSEYGSTVSLTANGATVDTANDPWGSDPQVKHTLLNAGKHEIRVQCSNGAGAYTQPNDETWTIRVDEPPEDGNNAPVATATEGSNRAWFGKLATYEVQCTDADEDDDLEAFFEVRRGDQLIHDQNDDFHIWGNEGDDTMAYWFPDLGRFQVKAWCRDDGDPARVSEPVTWDVTVTLEGIEATGDGTRVGLYFVHGVCSNQEMWDNAGRALYDGLRGAAAWLRAPTYVPTNDVPIHPLSAVEEPQGTARRMAEDLRMWVEEKRLDEVWLVGHSNGGLMARQLVQSLGGPDVGGARITKVVTLDSPDQGVLLAELVGHEKMILSKNRAKQAAGVVQIAATAFCAIGAESFSSGETWLDYVREYLDRDDLGNNDANHDWLLGLPGDQWMASQGIQQIRFVYGDPTPCAPMDDGCDGVLSGCETWTAACLEASGNLVVSEASRVNQGAVFLTNDPNLYEDARRAHEQQREGDACQEEGYGYLVAHPIPDDGIQHTNGHAFYYQAIRDIILNGPTSPTVADNAKERGEVFVNCFRELAERRGDVGPSIQVDVPSRRATQASQPTTSGTTNDFRDVKVEVKRHELKATVSRDDHRGATLTFQLDAVPATVRGYEVLLDDEVLRHADDYEDILDPNNDGDHGEYLVVEGRKGVEMLVSVPHFSERVITIRMLDENPSDKNLGNPETGAGIPSRLVTLVLLGLFAGLFLAYRGRQRWLLSAKQDGRPTGGANVGAVEGEPLMVPMDAGEDEDTMEDAGDEEE